MEGGPERLWVLPNFLDKAEIAGIVETASPRFTQSLVMSSGSGGMIEESENLASRTSDTAYIEDEDEIMDELLGAVVQRMHDAALLPRANGETLQVTRYLESERYTFHYDSGPELGRLATLLVFLTDVESGGETIFPFARLTGVGKRKLRALQSEEGVRHLLQGDGDVAEWWTLDHTFALDPSRLPPTPSPSTAPILPNASTIDEGIDLPMEPFCQHPDVLKFPPQARDALLWFNHHANLTMDRQSLHGGCPVGEGAGEKIIAQRWMRWYSPEEGNKHYRLTQACTRAIKKLQKNMK